MWVFQKSLRSDLPVSRKYRNGCRFILSFSSFSASTHESLYPYVLKICLLWLIVFLLTFCPAAAQESAVFYSQIPPGPVEAGQTLILDLNITNTGLESWVSGEFLVFVKIYDLNKEYMTETDELRQMVDVEPGESFSARIGFEVPPNYVGVYYYTVNVDVEDKGIVQSRYFRFEVQSLVPKPEEKPRYTGNFRMGYQSSEGSHPSSNFRLSLLNQLSPRQYRTVSISGKDFGLESSEINTFLIVSTSLIGQRQDRVELRAGDTSSALSGLTLDKLRGLRIGYTQGKTHLAGLIGINQDASSEKTKTELDIYGFKVSADATEDLSLGVNFAGEIKGKTTEPISEVSSGSNSTLGLEMTYDLASNLSMLGEYAWNIPYGGDSPNASQDSDAFHVEGSFDSEKIYIDGSYKKVGGNFSVPGNEDLKRDYLDYGVFMDYFVSPYLTTGLYYYAHMSHPSDEANKLLSTTKSVDVSFYPPGLPLLTLTYDIDEMEGVSSGSVGFPVDDVNYTFHGAFSQQFKNIRFSLGYLSSHYQDRTESASEDDFSLITYRVSGKWWDRLLISATQQMEQKKTDEDEDESSPAFSLAMTYTIIPKKLSFSSSWKIESKKEGEDDQTTTKTILRYTLSRSNILECSYSLTNYGSFTNLDTLISDEAKMELRWKFDFRRNQSLEASYVFTGSKDFVQTKTANTSSINFRYNRSF